MTKIAKLYGVGLPEVTDWTNRFTDRPTPEIQIASKRAVGIEVEVENVARRNGLYSGIWTNHADGSLRNDGAEYISAPIPACFAPWALQELLGHSLNQDECCFSPRTSIHVHLDMTGEDDNVVQNVMLLYTLFEKLLFRFTGRGRIKNLYCVPVMDTQMLHEFLQQDTRYAQNHWYKYSAFNLLPLAQHGTLEARHMHGTFDLNKVVVWVRMLVSLVDYCAAQDWKALRNFIQQCGPSTDYQQLLRDIFGADAEFLKYQSYDKDIESALGSVMTAFTSSVTTRALLELRDVKAPFYMTGK